MTLGMRHQSTVPVEALHTTLVNRLKALRHTGVDRGTTIIHRCPTQPQARFLTQQRREAAPPLVTNGEYTDSTRRLRDVVARIAGRGRTHTIPRRFEHCRRSGRPVDETPRIPRVTRGPGVAVWSAACIQPACGPWMARSLETFYLGHKSTRGLPLPSTRRGFSA